MLGSCLNIGNITVYPVRVFDDNYGIIDNDTKGKDEAEHYDHIHGKAQSGHNQVGHEH